jgi:glycosyltransferase involved in cell wall biosynthesis
MRPIVLNARAATRPELGGVERWAREMVARLPALDPVYTVARPPASLVHRAGHAWEQFVLPARAAAARASLLFSPANLAPLAWPRNVVVIHDAAALRQPSWYSRGYVAVQRALLPRIARGAVHVVTVSEFSRREIVTLLGVPEERVSVIPGGVDERFAPDADPAPAATRLDLRRPYVLTVASATSRKNLAALAPAAIALRTEGVDLVVAGGDRPQFADQARDDGLRRLGHVDDDLLPGLYAGAAAFVLPSLYEGFGLTCVEAMASGVPVVAADRGALPETCGGAALLVDPTDAQAIAQALTGLVAGGEPADRLRAAGRVRAAELTWQRSAEAVNRTLLGLASSDGRAGHRVA